MKNNILLNATVAIVCCLHFMSCKNEPHVVKSTFKYIQPNYTDVKLRATHDSIHFRLSESVYNDIKSFNYFLHKGTPYISFYDGRSASINIYDFASQKRVKKIKIKKWLGNERLYKTSVFVHNLDSIFIANLKTLYLYDVEGKRKSSIEFNNRIDQLAFFDNPQPPVLRNNVLFAGIRPWVKETSLSAMKDWRLLYGFNLCDSTKQVYYSLPEIYTKNIYGSHFLNYSFCYNNKGHFVFSFPADSNIYETNLKDYHVAHNGKSRFQSGDILPVPEEAIKNDEAYKAYRLRDSYSFIYYDAFHKRYLRLARQKYTEAEYASKASLKRQSLIIFNEKVEIISESKIEDDLSFGSLFFTADGDIYARVNSKDEYALHFVRLAYTDIQGKDSYLTKK